MFNSISIDITLVILDLLDEKTAVKFCILNKFGFYKILPKYLFKFFKYSYGCNSEKDSYEFYLHYKKFYSDPKTKNLHFPQLKKIVGYFQNNIVELKDGKLHRYALNFKKDQLELIQSIDCDGNHDYYKRMGRFFRLSRYPQKDTVTYKFSHQGTLERAPSLKRVSFEKTHKSYLLIDQKFFSCNSEPYYSSLNLQQTQIFIEDSSGRQWSFDIGKFTENSFDVNISEIQKGLIRIQYAVCDPDLVHESLIDLRKPNPSLENFINSNNVHLLTHIAFLKIFDLYVPGVV
jgi:hypothetical protein